MTAEEREQTSFQPLFQLMIENDSPLLKVLLNDLSYLLKTSHLKRVITLMAKHSPSNESMAK